MNFNLSPNMAAKQMHVDVHRYAYGYMHRCICRFLMLGLMCAALSACNSKSKPAAGQSLARVNDTEITVHQLNMELGQLAQEPQVKPKKEVLDGLIARELLVEQAQKSEMDRDPNVMQAIERAKEQILAQAYLKTKISHIAKPSDAEIEDFYQSNPQLFAQRKQFGTRELAINTEDLSPELEKLMANAQTLDPVQQWLDAHQVAYVSTQAVRSSVELPANVVKALIAMKPGQLFTIKQGDKSQLIALLDIKDSPLTLAMAREKIEQYLALQKSKQAVEAEVARLRSEAKITYLNQADQLDKDTQKDTATVTADGEHKKEPGLSTLERGVSDLK